MKRIILIVLLSLLFLATESFAATYYVREDGNDSACNGQEDFASSHGNPCAKLTIQAGVNLATTAGDTVYIHAGDYSSEGRISTAASGNASNQITISAYSGEKVTTGGWNVKHNYVTINGFDISTDGNWNSGGAMSVAGTFTRVTNNRFWPTLGSCSGNGTWGILINGTDNYFGSNTIEGDGTSSHGWHVPFCIEAARTTIENNIVRNLLDCERVFGTGDYDPNSHADNVTIRGNNIYNLTETPGGTACAHVDIVQWIDRGTGVNSAHNWTLENNYIHDCDSQGIGFSEIPDARATGLIVRNNVLANIKNSNMFTAGGSKYYNNTFYRVGYGVGQDVAVSYWGNPNCQSINNIVIGATTANSAGAYSGSKGSGSVFHHDYWGTSSYGAYDSSYFSLWENIGGTGSINGGDPKFVAAYTNCITNVCDFRLQSSSPLIGKGIYLSSVAKDKDGKTRTNPPTIGAYEFSSRPSPPQNLRVVP